MTDQSLRSLEAERNRLWAVARLKGLGQGTAERERIAELDMHILARKEGLRV